MELSLAWFEAIPRRLSVRRYAATPVPEKLVLQLEHLCRSFHSPARARVVVIPSGGDGLYMSVLGRVGGSYGSVHGARLTAAFIGREGCEADVGYVGQAFILEATTLGLATCWIAGSFDRRRTEQLLELGSGERVLSVTPVGYAAERRAGDERLIRTFVRAEKRLPLEKIAPGIGESWPAWARTAVEAARLAPSGGNRQPWRFRFDGASLALLRAEKLYWTAPIDLGIARLHVELGALHEGVRGSWRPLTSPAGVAVFTPSARRP